MEPFLLVDVEEPKAFPDTTELPTLPGSDAEDWGAVLLLRQHEWIIRYAGKKKTFQSEQYQVTKYGASNFDLGISFCWLRFRFARI